MGTSASSLKAANRRPLTVVSPVQDWRSQEDRAEEDVKNDAMDSFNHPRLRRLLILQSILSERNVDYVCSDIADDGLDFYKSTHSEGLLNFLDAAWDAWAALGEEGRDPAGWSPEFKGDASANIPPLVPTVVPFHRASNRQRPSSHVLGQVGYYCTDTVTPVFADLQLELHKDAGVLKRVLELLVPEEGGAAPPLSLATEEETEGEEAAESPATTDEPATDDPAEASREGAAAPIDGDIVAPAAEAESADSAEVVDETDPLLAESELEPEQLPSPPPSRPALTTPNDGAYSSQVMYALTTHPGHHAAHDSFGGYCYVNHVAALANHLQATHHTRVAILDVDYHCGNGTASIFDADPNVLVVSLHCHPDYDYPFHSGYGDETGSGEAKGTILHLPMVPGMEWKNYQVVLDKGLAKIRNFGATICLVSLGLDTLEGDPCAIRRAGFRLHTDDYLSMGKMVAKNLSGLPLVIVQEGGYRMDKVGEAAANFVLGCCTEP